MEASRASPTPAMGPGRNRDSGHEAANLLYPDEKVMRRHNTILPDWLRKKRYFVLLIAVLLGAGTALAVLGGLGRLGDLGKRKPESTAPKDGVSFRPFCDMISSIF